MSCQDTLITTLVNDLPFVKELKNDLIKIKKELKQKKKEAKRWREKHDAIINILYDYPSIMKKNNKPYFNELPQNVEVKKEVIDLTNDKEKEFIKIGISEDSNNNSSTSYDFSLKRQSAGGYEETEINGELSDEIYEEESNTMEVNNTKPSSQFDFILDRDYTPEELKQLTPFYRDLWIQKQKEEKKELCINTDCVEEKTDEYDEECNICDGYYKDDGLNDILFIEEDPNNKKANCDLCKKEEGIVQMKSTGQYICQDACDEDEEEVTDEDEDVEEEEVEEEEEEVEEEEEEEVEEQEEEVVEVVEEDTDDEEEEELFEIEIIGKPHLVTDEQNGKIYECLEDDEIGDHIGDMISGEPIFLKKKDKSKLSKYYNKHGTWK
jgi:hypothetical protein